MQSFVLLCAAPRLPDAQIQDASWLVCLSVCLRTPCRPNGAAQRDETRHAYASPDWLQGRPKKFPDRYPVFPETGNVTFLGLPAHFVAWILENEDLTQNSESITL